MSNREKAAPGQPVDELAARMEPKFQEQKETMRRCIAGLTEYAAQLTAQGQEGQIPRLRQLCIEMAEFWGLAEEDTPEGFRKMAGRIGGDLDRTVSGAREFGHAPGPDGQAKTDILAGLELYAREMALHDDHGQWIAECEGLSARLRTEWGADDAPEMALDKDAFWALIAGAKEECGQDLDGAVGWLIDQLTALGPRQSQDFHDIMHGYQQLAFQYGLWSAAALMCGGCTDDGFIDFRAWLIAQGKEVYLAALADPDSLADVEAYGGCQFEELTYAGSMALDCLTGQDAWERTDTARYEALVEELRQDITYGAVIGYPCEWDEIETYLPRLCGKYLEPGTARFMAEHGRTLWNHSSEGIREARAGGPPSQRGPEAAEHEGAPAEAPFSFRGERRGKEAQCGIPEGCSTWSGLCPDDGGPEMGLSP